MTNENERNQMESNGFQRKTQKSNGIERILMGFCENWVSTRGLQGGTGNGLSFSQFGDPRRGGSADIQGGR